MKRILPVILVLAVLLLALISCGPKEVPTTTVEIDVTTTTNKPAPPKEFTPGISQKDEGWAFWAEN
jgi:predicted small lipoprotein YifL